MLSVLFVRPSERYKKPSHTGEGLVCAKLSDRFSTSLPANFGHNPIIIILENRIPRVLVSFALYCAAIP